MNTLEQNCSTTRRQREKAQCLTCLQNAKWWLDWKSYFKLWGSVWPCPISAQAEQKAGHTNTLDRLTVNVAREEMSLNSQTHDYIQYHKCTTALPTDVFAVTSDQTVLANHSVLNCLNSAAALGLVNWSHLSTSPFSEMSPL